MERYFPRNLLVILISWRSVQPCLESAWWAAAGGWWLTWTRDWGQLSAGHPGGPGKAGGERSRLHLLAEGAVSVLLQAIQLEGFPQERVEGFAGAEDGGGVGGYGEGGHVAQLLQGALAPRRPIQELMVLQVLRQPLQHGQRLIEIHLEEGNGSKKPKKRGLRGAPCPPAGCFRAHWHGNFGQLLPNAVLHDAPEVEAVVGFVGNAGSLLLLGVLDLVLVLDRGDTKAVMSL